MRSRITLSLSKSLVETINILVHKHGFSSKSDFIRHAIYIWVETHNDSSRASYKRNDDLEDIGFGLPVDIIKELEQKSKN